MKPLIHALLAKTARDNGYENTSEAIFETVVMSSARHRAELEVTLIDDHFSIRVLKGPLPLPAELFRSFADWLFEDKCFIAASEPLLAKFLRRSSELAQSLPNQAVDDYETQVQQALSVLVPEGTQNTEVERMVRQRVGQDKFRQSMIDYWGAACAVTGLTLLPALRASHAKPWADCSNDAERLNVYNGFLLSANLDALFDKFLISFDEDGQILIRDTISKSDRQSLGLSPSMKLRWVSSAHAPFLKYHREQFLHV